MHAQIRTYVVCPSLFLKSPARGFVEVRATIGSFPTIFISFKIFGSFWFKNLHRRRQGICLIFPFKYRMTILLTWMFSSEGFFFVNNIPHHPISCLRYCLSLSFPILLHQMRTGLTVRKKYFGIHSWGANLKVGSRAHSFELPVVHHF